MIVNIVCGGPIVQLNKTYFSEPNHYHIGVDRGSIKLLEHDIIPNACIGDFDSVSEAELIYIKQNCENVMVLNAEKDETDTEVGIDYAINLGCCKEIRLFGTMGGRFDHTMANLKLLARYAERGIDISLIDEQNTVKILKPGRYTFEKMPYQYLSFFAFGEDIKGLTFENLKYPLQDFYLKHDDIRCISNEMVGHSFEIYFETGQLLMINSRD